MKKTLLTLFGCVILASCTNEVEQMDANMDAQNDIQYVVEEESSPNVTLADIQAYMDKGSDIASRNGGDGEIEVITYQNDTVMYLLKYSNGWEMMPGDKRFPLRVAYNEKGTLNYANMHDAQRAWFESMAEEIHVMKKHGKGIENEYCKVWNAFSKKNKKKNPSSRSENGEWMLHNTRETVNANETISHLISTHWDQWSYRGLLGYDDYNMYCPLNSDRDGHRPAGCIAVAGAQVLYHFHKIWGVPMFAATTASYNARTNKYTFDGWGTSTWTGINNNEMASIALLLGHVGVLCNMDYQDDGSGSNINKLSNALSEYGIGCSIMNSWNSDTIRNNISLNKPIIGQLSGPAENGEEIYHALIIDGYRYISTTYTDVYIYIDNPNSYNGDMYDHDESGDPVPAEGPTQEETYTIESTYYQVNWGYEGSDNTYYLSYNPLYYDYGGETGTVAYKRNKAMSYNFYVK